MLEYDPSDPTSIEAFAKRLVGKTLRETLAADDAIAVQAGKGSFGDLLEKRYFRIDGGNRPAPDFEKAGVELKSTPLKKVGGRLVPKERLVLGMIDYSVLTEETWKTSSFLKKSSLLLLIAYLWEERLHDLDYVIKIARLWRFPEADLEIIRDDWELIAQKVRDGKAHELSEGDTFYLAASVKGAKGADRRRQPNSEQLAKPRAFSLKQSYMRSVVTESLALQSVVGPDQLASGLTVEQVLQRHFEQYVGRTADQIAEQLGVKSKRGAKNFYALLTKAILGVAPDKRVAEFEKGDIVVKTVRLKPSGVPKEDVSFPAFDYRELVAQRWDTSELKEYLSRRFFFVIYQINEDGIPTLFGTRFWTMPQDDLEHHARECFERTVELVREGRAEYLPRKSENKACHVRPHGRDSSDVIPLPTGGTSVRRSFWLNNGYVADELGTRRPPRG